MRNCKDFNLLNHCRQVNRPENLQIKYSEIYVNEKKQNLIDSYNNSMSETEILNDIQWTNKLKSYNDLDIMWKCDISFTSNGKEQLYSNQSYSKNNALKELLIQIEDKLLDNLRN